MLLHAVTHVMEDRLLFHGMSMCQAADTSQAHQPQHPGSIKSQLAPEVHWATVHLRSKLKTHRELDHRSIGL
jgi:hypothetical protein